MEKRPIQLSPEFKTQATKSIFAIAFFLFTYLLIFLLTLGITGFCIVFGGFVIIFHPSIFTLILGAAIASLGVFILIFLIKFLFKVKQSSRTNMIEIRESEEPELFRMIHEIVNEVGTKFPKRVYVSPDVNAAVFYDSNFWSMFFPVRKNLIIGIGLVNTVSKEEFRGILSHEFGHFSQRSMKVGSYVYNVNQIIFNLLFENDSYFEMAQRWANVHAVIGFSVSIAVRVNKGVQWVLSKLYVLVNKSYLGLSREMEFHADEIAASVTGHESLKNALLRMSLCDASYNHVLGFYQSRISENIQCTNLYNNQSVVMQLLCSANKLPLVNGFPLLSLEEQSKYNKSKLVIKNQWASHPTIEERILRLEKTGFSRTVETDLPAIGLFTNAVRWQNELTQFVFSAVKYNGKIIRISDEEFTVSFEKELKENSFSGIYNGYYDAKNPTPFDDVKTDERLLLQSEELFSDTKVDMVYSAVSLENDIQTISLIAQKSIDVKTFDYEGVRYKRKQANELVTKLKPELEQLNDEIKRWDYQIYAYFLDREKSKGCPQLLDDYYTSYFTFTKQFTIEMEFLGKISEELKFLQVTTPFEEIKSRFNRFKKTEEELKSKLKLLLEDDLLKEAITKDMLDSYHKYADKELPYFGKQSYFEENLNILYTALNLLHFLNDRKFFLLKRRILVYQEGLM